jgi:hypothetical protein
MSIKNSNDTIGNRTRDLPACRAVPQSTALPRTKLNECVKIENKEGINMIAREYERYSQDDKCICFVIYV